MAVAAVGCGDDAPAKPPHNKVIQGPVQPAPTLTGPLPDVAIEHSPLTLEAPAARLSDRCARAGDLRGRQRDGAGRDRADARLPGHAVRRLHRQPAVDAVDVRSHGLEHPRSLQRHHPHARQPAPVGRRQRVQQPPSSRPSPATRRRSRSAAPRSTPRPTRAMAIPARCRRTPRSRRSPPRARPPGARCFRTSTAATASRISGAFAYRATASDANTVPLLTDSSGRILAATRAYGDGREALSLNFAQSASLFHSMTVLHGVVSWATRGRLPGRAARLPRHPGRRLLPARRHLHRRHLPHDRDGSAGRLRLHERQARPGGDGRDALPHGLQRRRRELQRRAHAAIAAARERLQLDQPHLRPLRSRRAELQLRARRVQQQHQRGEHVRAAPVLGGEPGEPRLHRPHRPRT